MINGVEIWVEGSNDAKVIELLLKKHDLKFDIQWKPASQGEIRIAGSVEKLLDAMKVQISQRRSQPVGFVIDADIDPGNPGSSIQNRWNSIRNKLTALGLECPPRPDSTGTILDGVVNEIPSRVGIWLMPNNTDDGMLEHFLQELIQQDDLLLPIATKATAEASATDRRFPVVHTQKAIIHTWLAWQKDPGLQLGMAITSNSFRYDRPHAISFVNWFRTLFGLESPVVP